MTALDSSEGKGLHSAQGSFIEVVPQCDILRNLVTNTAGVKVCLLRCSSGMNELSSMSVFLSKAPIVVFLFADRAMLLVTCKDVCATRVWQTKMPHRLSVGMLVPSCCC